VRSKQFRNCIAISDIALPEMKVRVTGEFGQPGFLQIRVIVRIEVIERDSAPPSASRRLAT
jgi:hypothetical protein